MSTHHLMPPSPPQPAKKLRSCLSPSRPSRSISPDSCGPVSRSSSPSSEQSWSRKRMRVRWESEETGSDVTSYFATYSACEYDRTPLAPPSEAERACAMPARGSRCLNFGEDDDDEEVDDEDVVTFSDSETGLPPSPFASPEESDDETADEWSDCFARRRMMFASMSGGREGPQFEGFRSLSSTLVDLLRSVDCDEEQERIASREESESEDNDDDPASLPSFRRPFSEPFTPTSLMGDLFSRLREDSVDSEIGTPSLVSSADSEADYSRLASPRGSAVDFLPGCASSGKPQTQPTPHPAYAHTDL